MIWRFIWDIRKHFLSILRGVTFLLTLWDAYVNSILHCVWDCYDNYSTCGAKKPSANLLKLSTASIDIPLGYIPKGEKHIEWRVVCNRCADLCWYCDRPWNTKHLRREELEGWWILQKHSHYCKNTANIAKKTANIAKTQQILQKHSRYCKNTADFAKTQPIMQKHSQYCNNTENTANINIVTNRGSWKFQEMMNITTTQHE